MIAEFPPLVVVVAVSVKDWILTSPFYWAALIEVVTRFDAMVRVIKGRTRSVSRTYRSGGSYESCGNKELTDRNG